MSHERARAKSRLFSPLIELARFGGVGGLTTLVYFALLWVLSSVLTWPMWAQATLAYLPPLVLAYLLHRSFTFRSEKRHASAGPRFLIVQLGGMIVNALVIWAGADVAQLPFVVVQLAAIGLQVALTYVGQKFFAFA